ncbi:hypothetical protein ACFYQ5_29860 [Streptomyces sp. NPDC005794]|jgi:hypothetical protein|uniref:hypothetical protein n=1 Tax=Streptomyces sp. NPDC005794 TaxID=3364733 RepID=UPI003681009C
MSNPTGNPTGDPTNPTAEMNMRIAEMVKAAKPEEIVSLLDRSNEESLLASGPINQNNNNNPPPTDLEV